MNSFLRFCFFARNEENGVHIKGVKHKRKVKTLYQLARNVNNL